MSTSHESDAQPLSAPERAARWCLWSVEGLGPVRLRALRTACGGHVTRLWEDEGLRDRALAQLKLSMRQRALAERVLSAPFVPTYEAQRDRLGLHQHLLHRQDEAYPERLRGEPDAPAFLYIWGDVGALQARCLGLVGSRDPRQQDASWARQLSRQLSGGYGVCVVSGGARGMDTQAHLGALDAHGPTVAVMPSGLERLTPASNRAVFERIVGQGGALVSEYPLRVCAKRYHFPRRNRLIVALSDGILVLEARARGGTMLTARAALGAATPVCVVPYHPSQTRASGSLELLSNQGASLVRDAADVMQRCYGVSEVDPDPPAQASLFERPVATCEPSCPVERRVWRGCGRGASVDELTQQLGLEASALLCVLTSMELAGHITRVGAGRFAQAR